MTDQTLTEVLQRNIRRLRVDRKWSQRKLSVLLRGQGIRSWTPNAVALIEAGKQRADRLSEIAALCAVFGVSVGELISSDEPVILEKDQPAVQTNTIALALAGRLAEPDIAGLADLDTLDRYDATSQAARTLGINSFQFHALLHETVDIPFWSFEGLRDHRAGITEGMSESSIRALRGHATRELLTEMKAVMDRDGIEAVVERYDSGRQDLLKGGETRLSREYIEAYEAATGLFYQPKDERT